MDDLDDWEQAADDYAVPAAVAENTWEDEDEYDDDAADSWDAPAQPKEDLTKAAPVKPKKLTKQKILEREKKLEEEAREKAARMSEAEKIAERLLAQKMVEEADNRLTEELFMGGVSKEDALEKNVGVKDYVLKEEEHFENFAEEVGDKLNDAASSLQKVDFLKSILKSVTADMKLDDVNTIKSYMNVIYNEVRKNEVGKKKKTKKKATLKTARGGDMDDYGTIAYDDADDFDFI